MPEIQKSDQPIRELRWLLEQRANNIGNAKYFKYNKKVKNWIEAHPEIWNMNVTSFPKDMRYDVLAIKNLEKYEML